MEHKRILQKYVDTAESIKGMNVDGPDWNNNWRDDAACIGMETELFYPGAVDERKYVQKTCDNCPVKLECLATALATKDTDNGIHGGQVPSEKRKIVEALRRLRLLEDAEV